MQIIKLIILIGIILSANISFAHHEHLAASVPPAIAAVPVIIAFSLATAYKARNSIRRAWARLTAYFAEKWYQ